MLLGFYNIKDFSQVIKEKFLLIKSDVMYFGSGRLPEYNTDLICGEHVLHSLGNVTHDDHNAGDGRTRMDYLSKLVGGQGSLQSKSETT